MRAAVAEISFDTNEARFVEALNHHLWNREAIKALAPGVKLFPARCLAEMTEKVVRGPSPRAAEAIKRLSKAYAWILNDKKVKIDKHIVPLVPYVYCHRVALGTRRTTPEKVIEDVLKTLKQPAILKWIGVTA